MNRIEHPGQEGGRVLCTARQIVVLNSILIWLKYHEIIEFENIHAWASKIAAKSGSAIAIGKRLQSGMCAGSIELIVQHAMLVQDAVKNVGRDPAR